MNQYELTVMIPCRDRLHFTKKTIESIRENSSKFDKIIIYCYDNLSELDNERFSFFQNMIKENLIQYYSYDTDESLNRSFGKALAYFRWLEECRMRVLFSKPNKNLKRFYLLIDNDMLLGKNWDQYFISAAQIAPSTTHFLVKYPGGIPKSTSHLYTRFNAKNLFSKNMETFQILSANVGGGSGFWFMTDIMLAKHKWTHKEITRTLDAFKKHDSTMWCKIRADHGSRYNYVSGVIPPNESENPLVIHMGGVLGSMCNKLNNKTWNDEELNKQSTNDESFKDMSHSDIFEKYKNRCHSW